LRRLTLALHPGNAHAKGEKGKTDTWVIGGREVVVAERTELDEEDGPLVVGACAEVEYAGNWV